MRVKLASMRRRLTLFYILCLCSFFRNVFGGNIDVTWVSPAEGGAYGQGEMILGQWKAVNAIVSPSFRLCVASNGSSSGNEDSCGAALWPDVQASAGSYYISLAVPNVTAEEPFRLEMEDNFGNTALSPVFHLRPSAPGPSIDGKDATHSNDAPSHAAVDGASPAGQTTDPAPPELHTAPLPSSVPGQTSAPPPPPVVPNASPTESTDPNLQVTRNPAPVATYAVPISLVGAILVGAAALALYHHKRLSSERLQHASQVEDSRQAASLAGSWPAPNGSNAEKTLPFLPVQTQPLRLTPPTNLPGPRSMPARIPNPSNILHSTKAVSAAVFKASARSPRPAEYACSPRIPARDPDQDAMNADATHDVICGYLQPSPRPPYSAYLPAPQQVYARQGGSRWAGEWGGQQAGNHTPGRTRRDVYEAVAQAVGIAR